MGKMFFKILATFAEFEVDLIRLRTREGMAVARAQGKSKGRQPKLSPMQQRELRRMHKTGEYTITDLGDPIISLLLPGPTPHTTLESLGRCDHRLSPRIPSRTPVSMSRSFSDVPVASVIVSVWQ